MRNPTLGRHAQRALHPGLNGLLAGAWVPKLGIQGSKLFDISGNGNHGTLTNMDASTDWQAGALDFGSSGFAERVRTTNGSSLNITGPMTIFSRVRYTGSIQNRPFVSKWGVGKSYLLLIDFGSAGKLSFAIRVAGANKIARSAVTYNDGKYHNVFGTFNGVDVRLDIDFLERVVGDATIGPIETTSDTVDLGNYGGKRISGLRGNKRSPIFSKRLCLRVREILFSEIPWPRSASVIPRPCSSREGVRQ